jgi:hypothetical protein
MRDTIINEKVVDAIKIILNELNGGNRKDIAMSILVAVTSDHRTLQQSFWSAMLLAQMGYADARNDLRNEQAVLLAKLVKDLAEKNNMDMGLPYI